MCASASVDFTQRTSHWQISLVEIRHLLNMHSCCLVWFVISECKNVHVFSGEEGEAKSVSEGRKGEKKNGEMDEGSLGSLGVLIIHCSVVGSELTISPWLYPCLMI